MDSLQNLFYQVRLRFYELDLDIYCDACSELNRLALAAGLNSNLIAQSLSEKD